MRFTAILLTLLILSACQNNNTKQENISSHAFRLKPGEDLKEGIEKHIKEKNFKTGQGHFEIVSLAGTVSVNGSHLHLSISDSTGQMIGGHLLPGCKIYTTAEIVIQYSDNYEFTREKDRTTPWEELQIKEK